jgi:glycosyltransferase involved in cell wall biosynthesis
MEKLIKRFNKENTLIVISSYPPSGGEAAKLNAVACYTQNLLRAYKGRKIVVLSEIVNGYEKPYVDGNILVVPCWRYQSPKLYLDLLAAILRFDRPKQVLVQFEFNMLGSFVHSGLMPFLLLLIKIMGKSATVMMHQVIDDLGKLGGHLNLKKGLKRFILNKGLHGFYLLTGKFADALIVHEQFLKETLGKWVDTRKINVVSHGLYLEKPRFSKVKVREILNLGKNDFVLLMFGYITWYKGTDWVIEKVKKLAKEKPQFKIKLIVAGGQSATLKNKAHYKRFLSKVKKIGQDRNIIMTGFVPDNEVSDYFAAADLVVLPYRAMMSASGPLSFALSFSRPFIASNVLSSAFKNPDMKQSLAKGNLNHQDFIFNLKGNSFKNMITQMAKDNKALNKLNLLTRNLRSLRSWDNIVSEYSLVIGKATQKGAFAKIRGAVLPRLIRPLRIFVQ